MSGPNNDYDPVEVTPLQAAEVEAARDAAIAAIEQAGDLEALKQARLDIRRPLVDASVAAVRSPSPSFEALVMRAFR